MVIDFCTFHNRNDVGGIFANGTFNLLLTNCQLRYVGMGVIRSANLPFVNKLYLYYTVCCDICDRITKCDLHYMFKCWRHINTAQNRIWRIYWRCAGRNLLFIDRYTNSYYCNWYGNYVFHQKVMIPMTPLGICGL